MGKGNSLLEIGQNVLVRNEAKRTKMDKEFDNEGVIREIHGRSTYAVKRKYGTEIKRNCIQLRPTRG